MRVLALDVGDRRIGVALSDPLGILGSPLTIIERKGEAHDVDAVIELVRKHEVERIIVGLPVTLSEEIGPQAKKVQAFVESLTARLTVPVEFRDEAMSTLTAKRLLRESGARKSKRRQHDDALAAAVILQSYLDEGK